MPPKPDRTMMMNNIPSNTVESRELEYAIELFEDCEDRLFNAETEGRDTDELLLERKKLQGIINRLEELYGIRKGASILDCLSVIQNQAHAIGLQLEKERHTNLETATTSELALQSFLRDSFAEMQSGLARFARAYSTGDYPHCGDDQD